jgi:hypothetical protein
VFLSYARADGETRAAELRERLAREAPDIEIKQDRLFLEGGVGWWKQIAAAIDSVEFLILLVTPAAMASGNVEKEWRYARERGVCVYPVKGAPDPELQFAKMPRWMSKAHFFDLEKVWPTFIVHLRRGCVTPRVPFMAPDLPPNCWISTRLSRASDPASRLWKRRRTSSDRHWSSGRVSW